MRRTGVENRNTGLEPVGWPTSSPTERFTAQKENAGCFERRAVAKRRRKMRSVHEIYLSPRPQVARRNGPADCRNRPNENGPSFMSRATLSMFERTAQFFKRPISFSAQGCPSRDWWPFADDRRCVSPDLRRADSRIAGAHKSCELIARRAKWSPRRGPIASAGK